MSVAVTAGFQARAEYVFGVVKQSMEPTSRYAIEGKRFPPRHSCASLPHSCFPPFLLFSVIPVFSVIPAKAGIPRKYSAERAH
ncbi:MAG: hypothetical protein OXU61_10110, partial [Gammaproteobacteria bacterium]|nr:hypothetical protein [Gammaproteobacteria bacterium]